MPSSNPRGREGVEGWVQLELTDAFMHNHCGDNMLLTKEAVYFIML